MRLPSVTALVVLASGAAFAQPAPSAPAAAAAPIAATPSPPAIDVTDPALAPVPAPPRVLRDFRDAIGLVTARSTDLRVAQLEVRRAEGAARQALAGALPSVVASGTVTRQLVRDTVKATDPSSCRLQGAELVCDTVTQEVPSDPMTASAQITASQPILAPRAWYAIGTADRATEASRRTYEDRRRTVLAGLASSIIAVVTAERVAEINRVGLRSSLERLELVRRRVRAGAGASLDVVRSEQDVVAARATLIQGDESLRQAREALGLALGSNDAYGVRPDVSLDAVAGEASALCTPGSPGARADVLAARAQLEVAERGVTDVKLAYAPTAELSTTATYQSKAVFGDKHYTWSIQGMITLPIWDGGARYGSMRVAKAQAAQQKEVVDVTIRQATLEATRAERSVAVAEQSRLVAQRATELARETARLSQVAFEAGAGTSFELVDAAKGQRDAELQLALREFDLVSAKITALLATASCNY
jgi:outer membrane protein TolC